MAKKRVPHRQLRPSAEFRRAKAKEFPFDDLIKPDEELIVKHKGYSEDDLQHMADRQPTTAPAMDVSDFPDIQKSAQSIPEDYNVLPEQLAQEQRRAVQSDIVQPSEQEITSAKPPISGIEDLAYQDVMRTYYYQQLVRGRPVEFDTNVQDVEATPSSAAIASVRSPESELVQNVEHTEVRENIQVPERLEAHDVKEDIGVQELGHKDVQIKEEANYQAEIAIDKGIDKVSDLEPEYIKHKQEISDIEANTISSRNIQAEIEDVADTRSVLGAVTQEKLSDLDVLKISHSDINVDTVSKETKERFDFENIEYSKTNISETSIEEPIHKSAADTKYEAEIDIIKQTVESFDMRPIEVIKDTEFDAKVDDILSYEEIPDAYIDTKDVYSYLDGLQNVY